MTPTLSVNGLCASIGKIPVLRGVDLHVRSGETVALLGRNGVGKTSALRAILGLLPRKGGRPHPPARSSRLRRRHRLRPSGPWHLP
jgi:branched-chain amino acid transport system ATP-binding protein